MNKLKAEIERKRKALDEIPASTEDAAPAAKAFRWTDLERKREAEYYAARKGPAPAPETPTPPVVPIVVSKQVKEGVDTALERFNVSNEEAIKRLRAKGQPIRLFDESDKDRRLRLRALELIETRSKESGQRNDFMKALEAMDQGELLEELARRGKVDSDAVRKLRAEAAAAPASGAEPARGASTEPAPKSDTPAPADDAKEKDQLQSGETIVDLDLVKSNPHKVYPQIYFALKKILRDWEQYMAERPDHVKRSTQGKLAAATQKQSAEYLKPLFKSLRKRELEPDVLAGIAGITHYTQTREYLKANDAYLKLSIGNAPWPIGVTMVGIHARSAREKINTNQTAHVLNDEVSRKYIQSLKRLMSFSQTIRPPDDLSELMG